MVYTQEGVIKDSKPWAKIFVAGAMAVTLATAMFASAFAATTTVVSPANTQGWSMADTRPGGTVQYVEDSTAPGVPSVGALQLQTSSATSAKAQYLKSTETELADVNNLGYSTKQLSANFSEGTASYQLVTCLGGLTAEVTVENPLGCAGFTTFVYEPYNNEEDVVNGVWQEWDATSGDFWSSRAYTDSENCTVAAGGGGAPYYTLEGLQENCPDAVVVGFGVNIGSNNPSYNIYVDAVEFNEEVYNFEPYVVASTKDQCKNGGWESVVREDESTFKNQGACVSYASANANASFKKTQQ